MSGGGEEEDAEEERAADADDHGPAAPGGIGRGELIMGGPR
jgi:hypothetical protein